MDVPSGRLPADTFAVTASELVKVLGLSGDAARQIARNQVCTSVAIHSAHVQPGGLFIAFKGRITDGHRYLEAARDNGASLIICERVPNGTTPDLRKR